MTDNAPPTLEDVRRIADELRLKIHLAGMEARDRWDELQPRLVELESRIEETGKRASAIISDQITALAKALRKLRDEIVDSSDRTHPIA